MLGRNARPPTLPEMKLEQIVGGLGAGLTGKDEHGVSGDGDREVAASRRRIAVTLLSHFLPMQRSGSQGNGPHVVEARVAVVSGEDPEFGVVNAGAVSGASDGYASFKSPFHPLAGGELIFVEVVLVGEITVAVNVARVTAENEHAALMHDGRVVISGRRWVARRECPAPGFVLAVKPKEVVEHGFPIVAAKDVDGIFVRDNRVFAASCSNKFIAFWHSTPLVHGFEGSEI